MTQLDFLSYEECRQKIQGLNMNNRNEFHKKYKELNLSTKGVPRSPQEFYKRKGTWVNWYDFLKGDLI
jgi:hypothetical protein